MARHQDFGQDSKQGKADVSEFASRFIVTIHIESHGFAFGVKFNFHNCSAKCLTLTYEI